MKTAGSNTSLRLLPVLIIPAFFAFGYIVYPLIVLLMESLPAFTDSFGAVAKNSALPLWNSVLLSAVTVAGSCIIGVALAYVV